MVGSSAAGRGARARASEAGEGVGGEGGGGSEAVRGEMVAAGPCVAVASAVRRWRPRDGGAATARLRRDGPDAVRRKVCGPPT